MPLTAEDVRNKQFGTVRFKEGYRLDEVDAFLDQVEAQISLLVSENESLRARLAALTASGAAPAATPAVSQAPAPAPAPIPMPAPVAAPAPVTVPVSAALMAPPAAESAALVVAGDPTVEMAAMLAMAKRTADAHIAEADEQAEGIMTRARDMADSIAAESEEQQAVLERRIEELRAFEREYRNRLRAYLEGQLSELEAGAEFAVPAISTERSARPEGAGSAAVTAAAASALAAASRPAVPAAPATRLTITAGEVTTQTVTDADADVESDGKSVDESDIDHTAPIPAFQPFAPATVSDAPVTSDAAASAAPQMPAPSATGFMAPPSGQPSPVDSIVSSLPAPTGAVVERDSVAAADVVVVEEEELVVEPSAAEPSVAPKFVSPYSQNISGS